MNLTGYIRERLKKRRVLIMAHCVVGYPSLEANWQMLKAMQKADIDLVELQMPFSEPIADGPLFVKANQKAIKQGITIEKYFDFFKKAVTEFSFPIFMMGYYNSIFRKGHERFIKELKNCGGAGFIVPDLPKEEFGNLFELSRQAQVSPIMFFTPKSTDKRMVECAQVASGFIYCIARKGVTGRETTVEDNLTALLARYRTAADLPLALGFGLSKKDDIYFLHDKAEIAVVGSALLRIWEEKGPKAYQDYLNLLAFSRFDRDL